MTNFRDRMFETFADKGALFNVRREVLTTESGISFDNKFALINESNNRPIGIVSGGYKVVSNADTLGAVCDAVEVAQIDTTDAFANIRSSWNGGRSIMTIGFPAIEYKGSVMQIVTLNSYDGRWKYLTKAGAIRMKCMNGQIGGDVLKAYSSFHNRKLDVNEGAKTLVSMIEDFNGLGKWWDTLAITQVTDQQVIHAIAKYLGINPASKDAILDNRSGVKLLSLVDAYFAEMGKNAYALYNAFTDHITHKKRGENADAHSLVADQMKFERLLANSKAFALAA